MTTENNGGAPIDKKNMTPEQRAAAIKAAQEKALKMKADRDAAKAAAEGAAASVQPATAAVEQTTPAAAPIDKKNMTPEQRAAAVKAAQEKALALKAARDAAKAGGTAVAVAEPTAPTVAMPTPAGQPWRIPAAGAGAVSIARPDARQLEEVGRETTAVRTMMRRRQVLRGGVFATLGGFTILGLGSFLNYFNPRHVVGFGGVVPVAAAQVPKPGDDPKKFFDGKFFLVNLKEGEGGNGNVPGAAQAGVIAIYQKCVHLGCTVPWRPEFDFNGSKGWFRCPCHGSTYTRAGVYAFGPAPRSLDTFAITVNGDGSLAVNTGKITNNARTDSPKTVKLPS